MRYTRILCILLCFLCVMCTACNNDSRTESSAPVAESSDESTSSVVDESSNGELPDEEDLSTEVSDTEPQPDIFGYKMAKVKESDSILTFAIECMSENYTIREVEIRDKDGNDIKELCSVQMYAGCVCPENETFENAASQWCPSLNHKSLHTFVITMDSQKFTFDDLIISGVPFDPSINMEVGAENPVYERETLQFNADISNLTTKQKYIHSQTLVQIEGEYFIPRPNTTASESGTVYCYEKVLIPLTNIPDTFHGYISLVNANGKHINPPQNTEYYNELGNVQLGYGFRFGLKSTADNLLTQMDFAIAKNSYLKYEDKYGFEMIFFDITRQQ